LRGQKREEKGARLKGKETKSRCAKERKQGQKGKKVRASENER